ncbi:LVIVD repeat-containing protein [Persicitalea jodogahamensis]|uniref:LVIVD repeat-containing protein n=1 Tax=Persicitalea jodogahamensis TaxID=402147 RepID=A0A8J3D3J2_9BACT|nr:hypothetical protein [Persicitalea jodogahamensis]GHB65193.1 hypothetical protein GCM10007390_19110 [Persicitalea jodogahamensis]
MKAKFTKCTSFLVALLVTSGLIWGCSSGLDSANVSPGSQTGVGGSMARFAITGNTLYIATKQSLEVYDITQPDQPVRTTRRDLGVGIETIFPYKNNLFIGSNNGMYIFDNSDPKAPRQLSFYSHIQSCDPVVVQGNYAYVTLRNGSTCRQQFNTLSSLDVVDISNLSNPRLMTSINMESPYGLGVDGNRLFVGEGSRGLKLFDISDPLKPVLKEFRSDIPTYDVIPYRSTLIITGEKGIFQYRYDDRDQFDLLSKILVE